MKLYEGAIKLRAPHAPRALGTTLLDSRHPPQPPPVLRTAATPQSHPLRGARGARRALDLAAMTALDLAAMTIIVAAAYLHNPP